MSYNWGMAGLGGLGSGLSDWLFPNPANGAQGPLNTAEQQLPGYYNPYIQAGQGAMGNLESQYSNLMNNPGGAMNQIGQSFHQSPGFQFALNQAMQGGNRGMAAGGLAGSPSNQMQNMGTATQMGNQDYYNYLDKAMGMYGMGLQGEQGMMGQGYNASNELGQGMSNMYGNQAILNYAGQADQNANMGGLFGDIASIFGGK